MGCMDMNPYVSSLIKNFVPTQRKSATNASEMYFSLCLIHPFLGMISAQYAGLASQ